MLLWPNQIALPDQWLLVLDGATLAPDIQEEILFLPRTTQGRDAIKEADICPIAKTLDWNKQRQMWNRLRQDVNDASSSSQKSSMA
jgi:hypothetical protein